MKIAILTGGGDVSPLNAVIRSVIDTCEKTGTELYGIRKGWEGLLSGDFIKLNGLIINPLIGGTILKSSRVNLAKIKEGSNQVLSALKRQGIDGLIVIGGEDTLSNALYLKDFPKILISKTIDNDVGRYSEGKFLNYFTLGHPTAADKISSFVSFQEGLRTTAYSHERIIVVESMGMHAGWLALSSSSGNPDFIIIPEFPLKYSEFAERVKDRFLEQRNVIIVISEGAKWEDGSYISADDTEKDSFGHPRFRGTAELLAKKLKTDLSSSFDTRNVNAVNPSYLYRSGQPNALDHEMAKKTGSESVNRLLSATSDSVFLSNVLTRDGFNVEPFLFDSLDNIEQFHRFVDSSLYDALEFKATSIAKEYFSTISKQYPAVNISF